MMFDAAASPQDAVSSIPTQVETAIPLLTWVEHIMGMPISIHVRGDSAHSPATSEAVHATYSELRWWENVFSPTDPNSPMREVQQGNLSPSDVCQEMVDVFTACEQAKEVTRGYFDHWLPDDQGSFYMEPAGMVQGWAISESSAHLNNIPNADFAINAGGDVLVGSTKPAEDRHVWNVGVENPYSAGQVPYVVQVSGARGAVATSGLAGRNTRIYNPMTGQLVHREGSVTVTGPSLVWADIWATALYAGPPELVNVMTRWDPAYGTLIL